MASSTFSAEDGPAHLPADTVDGARLRAGGNRGEGGGKGRAGARGRARLWANVDRSRRPRPPACGNESNYFTLRAMGRTRLTRTHDGTTRTTRNFCRNKFEHRGRAYKKPHGRISRRGSQQNRRCSDTAIEPAWTCLHHMRTQGRRPKARQHMQASRDSPPSQPQKRKQATQASAFRNREPPRR